MNRYRWIVLALTLWTLAGTGIAPAQTTPPPEPTLAAAPMSQDLLDSLLAPIALYPDQLLSQVLMASTYPLEVVEAARFVRASPGLSGEALDRALEGKTWDASVLSLCAFPQVLDMMDTNLEWTQRVGDAFLADAAAVMRTVQALRLRAQQAGNLQSTAQQNVIVQDRTIVIEPAQPEYVYVPVYNPEIIYGTWWAPAYPPWYWYPGPVWGYPSLPPTWGYGAGIFWGTAWAITAYNWGWCRPNWGGYAINVNVRGNNPWVNRPYYRDRYANSPNWSHAPEHRRGIAYRDPGTAQRYRPANPGAIQTRESYRGRDVATRPAPGAPGGTGSFARPDTGATTRSAPPPQRASDIGSTIRPTPLPTVPGHGTTTRPAAPTYRTGGMSTTADRGAAQAVTACLTVAFATRSAPPASYPQPPTASNRGRKSSATPPAARRAGRRWRSPRRSKCTAEVAAQAVISAPSVPTAVRRWSGGQGRGPGASQGGGPGAGQGGGQMRHR
jgi:hypothetical protein